MEIKEVVMQAVRKYNEKKLYYKSVNEDTVLRGDKSPLDSLAFVGLMVAVERELNQATGKDMQIFKPEYFLGKSENPYKTVGSLVALAKSLYGEGEKSAERKVKIVFTDLDGTLYDGVAGEDKMQFKSQLLNELLRLMRGGVLIVSISKNYESTIREAFGEYYDEFSFMCVACKYNILDKAACIRDMCIDLNLGIDSAVFLDDDEHERDRVKTALTMVWVPENHMDIAKIEAGAGTEEDRNRTAMYKQEYERARSKPHSDSTDDYMMWLAGLDMVLTAGYANNSNINRAVELFERCNQFRWKKRADDRLFDTMYVFSLRDKFGDMGLIGVATEINENLHQLCISCRVLGRGVEYEIVRWLCGKGFSLSGPVDTGKNKAAMDFWRKAGNHLNQCKYPIKVVKA